MTRAALCCTALLVLLVPSRPAHADPASAREHFQRGSTLYDLGRYRDAAKEYEAAYEARNEPSLLFNIGQAYRFAGDWADAIRAYRSFLRRVPNTPQRALVEAQVQKIELLMEQQKRTATGAPTSITPLPPSTTPETPTPTPTPAPAPITTTTPEPEPSATPAVVVAAPTPKEQKPLYKRGWFWGVIAASAAVVAVGIGVGVGVTPSNAAHSNDALRVSF